MIRFLTITLLAVAVLSGCGGGAENDGGDGSTLAPTDMTDETATDDLFPDVLDVTVTPTGSTYRFDVTMSSPYDTPQRYADAWRVRGPDGTVYGVRELLHDHQFEQPFTRSLPGVSIPEGVETVIVEGRDQINGWGGKTAEVGVPRPGS